MFNKTQRLAGRD
jgi:hypothetical protein